MIALVKNGVVAAVFNNEKDDVTQEVTDWNAFAKGRGEVAVEVGFAEVGDKYPAEVANA